MAITINSSSSSLVVNQLGTSRQGLVASLEKIASGKRINKAADDAAGLAIANSLLSQGRGLGQAMRNANDVMAMTRIADSGLDQATALVQSVRQKALQAANASQSAESRQALQSEIAGSLQELNSLAANTTYNGQPLLNGALSEKTFQVGANAGETITLSIGSVEAGKLGDPEAGGMLSDISVLSEEGAQETIRIADEALARIADERGRIGAAGNRLSSVLSTLATTGINTLSAASTIADVDLAEEVMNFARMKVLTEAGVFSLTQARNVNKESVLGLLQG